MRLSNYKKMQRVYGIFLFAYSYQWLVTFFLDLLVMDTHGLIAIYKLQDCSIVKVQNILVHFTDYLFFVRHFFTFYLSNVC